VEDLIHRAVWSLDNPAHGMNGVILDSQEEEAGGDHLTDPDTGSWLQQEGRGLLADATLAPSSWFYSEHFLTTFLLSHMRVHTYCLSLASEVET
jgi:hypothetical protein